MEAIGPGSAAALAIVTALISKEHLSRLLGPSEDVIGAKLANWMDSRINRTAEILEAGYAMLQDPDNTEKMVPPRVLDEIIENGSWAEDDVIVQYFGGVLASSRTTVPRDDRGVVISKMVSQLSTYQVRAHYIIYRMMKDALNGMPYRISTDTHAMDTFIPLESFVEAMEFSKDEDWVNIIQHSLKGLESADLIHGYILGDPVFLKTQYFSDADVPGIAVSPHARGIELFLWAHGLGDRRINDYLSEELIIEPQVEIKVPETARISRRHKAEVAKADARAEERSNKLAESKEIAPR